MTFKKIKNRNFKSESDLLDWLMPGSANTRSDYYLTQEEAIQDKIDAFPFSR